MTPETTPSRPTQTPAGEETTTDPRDAEIVRLRRYGKAIWETSRNDEGTISATGANIVARAVMAVADSEQAELRAEVARLRAEQRHALDTQRPVSAPAERAQHAALRLDPTPLTEASVEDYIRASAEAHGQDADAAVWAWRQQAAAAANEPGVTVEALEAECARLSETVARVEALADEAQQALDGYGKRHIHIETWLPRLRAALTGPTETGDKPA